MDKLRHPLFFSTYSRLEIQRMPGRGWSTYRGGRYCGPGWGFTRHDVESGLIRELPDALDAIDEACRRHDQCYQDRGWFTSACNLRLGADLMRIVRNPAASAQQRADAAVMAAVFYVEAVTVDQGVAASRALRDALVDSFAQGLRMSEAIERALIRQSMGLPF